MTVLAELVRTGFFRPSIEPRVACVRGPQTGRWSDDDIKALKRYRALRGKRVSKKDLVTVGANLRKRRPELATNGSYNNEAFARTKLVERFGDVCEPTEDGGHSWLLQPGRKLMRDLVTFVDSAESGDRTIQELVHAMRKHYEKQRNGEAFAEYHYDLMRVMEVYSPGLRKSEITQQHLDEYPEKRRELAGKPIADSTIRGELKSFKLLLRFEFTSRGYTHREAAKRAGVTVPQLSRLARKGLIKPSIQPPVFVQAPRVGRYGDADIKAIQAYVALRKEGFSAKTLALVATNLRNHHSELARGG